MFKITAAAVTITSAKMKLSTSVVENARTDHTTSRPNRHLRQIVVEEEEDAPEVVEVELTNEGLLKQKEHF